MKRGFTITYLNPKRFKIGFIQRSVTPIVVTDLIFNSPNNTYYQILIDNDGNMYTIVTSIAGVNYLVMYSANGAGFKLMVDNEGNIYQPNEVVTESGVLYKLLRAPNGDNYSLTISNDGNLIQTKI